jgi:ribonuclease BN (tRNA processing enzyme)
MPLSFTFLGTGAPPVSLRRAGPAHLVRAGGTRVLIDCGAQVSHRLVEAGCPGASLDALIVTHLHSDHTVDFYQLIVSSWHQGRDRPWRIIAPQPVLALLRAIYDGFRPERELRIAFEKRPSATGLEVSFEELKPGPIAGLGELAITAFEVDHAPVEPAFGLAIAAEGQRIVFSGDTRPCEALATAATGVDLLVTEVYVARDMPPVPGVRSAETAAAVRAYHMTPDEVASLALRAGAKMLALTHLVPPATDTAALISDIRAAGYDGPALVGEDLLTVTLPERLVTWKGLAAVL